MRRATLDSCDLAPIDLATSALTHYVIIRADLPEGVQLAQTIHAAGESSPGNIPKGTYAVALEARDELALLRLESALTIDGIAHVAIREPDPPWNNQLMAIGVAPCQREHVRRHLRSFPAAYSTPRDGADRLAEQRGRQ